MPPKYPNTNIRNIGLQGGDPAAFADLSRQNAQNAGASASSLSPSQTFGLALTNLLKQYQQLGTRPFQEQEIQAREVQAQRILKTPSSDLYGASPQLQSNVRNAAAQALQPTVQGASQARQTFSEQLRSFGDVLGTARQFASDFEAQQNKARDDARNLIKDSFSLFGGAAFDGADPQEVMRMEKLAGLPKGYITNVGKTLKERELELKNQTKALYGGLTPSQVNQTVNQIAGAFDNEPVVKNFNVIAEGYNFVKNLSNKTTNPADDQALIYALAKALDPASVVREGEYATAQKYSQSWIASYGKTIQQALAGTGFLSETARRNIKATIEARYKASQQNYNNVRSEYQRQIEDARTGKPREITDYAKAYQQPTAGTGDIRQVQQSLDDDIRGLGSRFSTREQLIAELVNDYPEFTQDQIARRVYTLIPDR